MTERDLGRLLASAVPTMAAPPDRLAQVGARVRRRRLATATAAAIGVVAVIAGTAVLRPVPTPAGNLPPASRGPEIDVDPICVPRPDLTPVPTPVGTQWPPRIDGAVRVTLCEWRLERNPDRYELTRRLVVTDGVGRVVSAILALPADEVNYSDLRCATDVGYIRRLAFDFDDRPREWVLLVCDVAGQSFWFRYGARNVVLVLERAYADQPSEAATSSGRPTR
jgi:hypothetical protein